jgi:hypothetical protein
MISPRILLGCALAALSSATVFAQPMPLAEEQKALAKGSILSWAQPIGGPLRPSCNADLARYCPGYQADGQPRQFICLVGHLNELSKSCRKVF